MAPQTELLKLMEKEQWTEQDILLGINLISKQYNFTQTDLLIWLGKKESQLGKDKRCGDHGKSCYLFQIRENTWTMFQNEFGRQDLKYSNNINQIEMTIIALQHGYWYLWGPLYRNYKSNPIKQ